MSSPQDVLCNAVSESSEENVAMDLVTAQHQTGGGDDDWVVSAGAPVAIKQPILMSYTVNCCDRLIELHSQVCTSQTNIVQKGDVNVLHDCDAEDFNFIKVGVVQNRQVVESALPRCRPILQVLVQICVFHCKLDQLSHHLTSTLGLGP